MKSYPMRVGRGELTGVPGEREGSVAYFRRCLDAGEPLGGKAAETVREFNAQLLGD